ncbi:tetratricopeptide repeat protein [Methylophilus luteus]|uniref:Tetratricopeptide repeat protein n=1 Tax=Methylophilus luteus TaxID=640108 RepID=A0ABW3F533_9PROT
MSLINQVLKDVEARQGGTSTDGWAGQQVKPVLSHAPTGAGQWFKRLLMVLVLAGLAVWAYLHSAELTLLYRSALAGFTKDKPAQVAAAVPVKPVVAPVATPAPAEIAVEQTPPDTHPQLTKSLFSEWQAELSASVTKPPIRQKITPMSDSASSAAAKNDRASLAAAKSDKATQVEGEFTIRPADNAGSATVVSVIEPPPETGNAGKNRAGAEAASEDNGTVSKHVRPEQQVNVLIQKAVDHEQKGRLSEALATLRQALVTYPQSEDARQLLAAYLFENKQETEAVALLQAGIKRFPEQAGLARSLAKWQLAHKQPEAVLQTLKPHAYAFARDAEAQWMQAIAYQQLNQHQAALPYFERALVLQPGQAQWQVAYAISLQASGQNAQALQQLQAAQGQPLSDRLAEFVAQRIRQLGGASQARDE